MTKDEALAEQKLSEPCRCGKQTNAWCMANTCSKAEQPAQQQEPVEYVRKMIDALYENGDPVSVEAAELLERMTRQQQEPAAWVETREDGSIYYGVETDTVISDDPSWLERPMPVYTSPPASKPWVGLTEKEENELWEGTDSDWELMKRTEAKLREKNA